VSKALDARTPKVKSREQKHPKTVAQQKILQSGRYFLDSAVGDGIKLALPEVATPLGIPAK
jgi:hypothetical protein